MWPAFPTSDYYENSANSHRLGDTLLCHRCEPSLVHMLDSNDQTRLPIAVFTLAFRKSSQMSWPSYALSVTPCRVAYISSGIRGTSPYV